MTEFNNPTHPSHFINGSLVRKRRVYAPHELRPARRVGGTMGNNQGPAYFTRTRSSPVRRPRAYLSPPVKLLKGGCLIQSHHIGHLLGGLVLNLVLDQDLLLTPEVDLDLTPIADPPQGMKLLYLHGEDNLKKFLNIKRIFSEM